MKNPEKVIDVLTEKLDQTERQLSLAQYYLEQAKHQIEENEKKIEWLENQVSRDRVNTDEQIIKGGRPRPVRQPSFEKRPATEKAEETR